MPPQFQQFNAALPTEGLFRSTSGYGETIYRRTGNGIEQLDTLSLLSPQEKQSAGNRGQQASLAQQKLIARGIIYSALPAYNIADVNQAAQKAGIKETSLNSGNYITQNNDLNSFVQTGISAGNISYNFNTPQDFATAQGQFNANKDYVASDGINAPQGQNGGYPSVPGTQYNASVGNLNIPAGTQGGNTASAMTPAQINAYYDSQANSPTPISPSQWMAQQGGAISGGAAPQNQGAYNVNSNATTGNSFIDSNGNIKGTNVKSTSNIQVDKALSGYADLINQNHAAGNVINSNLAITPELAAKFVADSHTQLDPFYQQSVNQVIGDVNANVSRVSQQYQNEVGAQQNQFQQALDTERNQAGNAGVAFSGGRGLKEEYMLSGHNYNLGNLALQYGGQLRDILTGGAAKIGASTPGLTGGTASFNLPNLQTQQATLEGPRGGVAMGGNLQTGYNPSNYQYGTIGNEFKSGMLGTSNEFLSNYLKTAANNSARQFQLVNGAPQLM